MEINSLASLFGGVVAMSNALGLSRGAVSQWNKVPVDKVIKVCELCGWQVTPHELRPDIYPNPTDGLPADHQEAA